MTEEERNIVRNFLLAQGVTFDPLREEMADHLICDIENRLVEGLSFEQAFSEAIREIPTNHLKQIQEETMESINKRATASQWLSIGALFCLFVSMFFKILHYQFADELLLMTFVFIGGSLITAALTGVRVNRDKNGPYRLIAITVSIIFLIVAYAFFIFHLPGGQQLANIGVLFLATSSIIMTIYASRTNSSRNELLMYLHEKHTPGIERFLLIILVPLTLYSGLRIYYHLDDRISKIFLLIVMFAATMQLIAIIWRYITRLPMGQRQNITIGLCALILCFSALFLGRLVPFNLRVSLIVIVTLLGSWLAWTAQGTPRTVISTACAVVVPVIFSAWALIVVGVLPNETASYFFNIPVLLLLVSGLFMCRKLETMRAFMIMSVSSYLFEFLTI